jgi:hypothetical protein
MKKNQDTQYHRKCKYIGSHRFSLLPDLKLPAAPAPANRDPQQAALNSAFPVACRCSRDCFTLVVLGHSTRIMAALIIRMKIDAVNLRYSIPDITVLSEPASIHPDAVFLAHRSALKMVSRDGDG